MKDPFRPWRSSPKHPGVHKGIHQETGVIRWRVFYRPVGATYQTSKSFETLDAARRFRAAHEKELERARDGRGRPAPNRSPTVRDYVNDRLLPRYAGDTRTMYSGAFKAVEKVAPDFMGTRIGRVTGADIEIMLTRLGEVYRPSTVNKVRSAVAVALNRAADDGLIERLTVRIPKRRVEKPQRPPSPAELQLVVQALKPLHRAPVLVAAAAGLRSGELRALRPEDISGLRLDLRAGWSVGEGPYSITVRRQLDRMGRELSLPKSQASQRTVGVIPEVVQTVADHLNQFGVGRDGMLWPVGSEALRRAVSRASAKAIGRPFKVHTLRRYFGTQLVYSGVPVHDIQRDLGHADPGVTMTWYLAALEGQAASEAKRQAFGALFQSVENDGVVVPLQAKGG